jgi:cytidine deaminase
LAINSKGDSSIFSGCNIEISFSRAFHAENVALLKAISSGYTNIKAIGVTSDSKTKQAAAMCVDVCVDKIICISILIA